MWWRNVYLFLRQGSTYDQTEYIKKRFVPHADITAYELAYLVSKFVGMGPSARGINFTCEQWHLLDHQYKRHFVD